jgi:hypothetical protein
MAGENAIANLAIALRDVGSPQCYVPKGQELPLPAARNSISACVLMAAMLATLTIAHADDALCDGKAVG